MGTARELELLEAIQHARRLLRGIEEAVRGFPSEGGPLAELLLAAARRTVVNLELALATLRREQAGSN